MKWQTLFKQATGLAAGVLLTLVTLALAGSVMANVEQSAPDAARTAIVQEVTASPPVISYVGRLLDPATGLPKANGSYTVAFSLYDVPNGGAPLWTEIKSVSVANGLFTTLLGDATPLNLAQFNGQDLFLGITVGSDPEASPRSRIAHTAYAIRAAAAAVAAVADNANLLGGQGPSAFAVAGHLHDDRYFTEAEEDGRFINSTGPETITGDFQVNGDVRANKLIYNNPRTHYFSVSGDNFQPRSINPDIRFFSAGSSAGSYFATGDVSNDNRLLAAVNLPQGARMTSLTGHFFDSGCALDLELSVLKHATTGGYTYVQTVSSAGINGSGSKSGAMNEVINNATTFYEFYVDGPSNWETCNVNLRIIGATITYTINEAE